jgi:hypothetical protein
MADLFFSTVFYHSRAVPLKEEMDCLKKELLVFS